MLWPLSDPATGKARPQPRTWHPPRNLSGKGRTPGRVRQHPDRPPPLRVDALAAALPASAWRRYRTLEGARGPLVADFAVLRVVAVRLAASLLPLVGAVLLPRRSRSWPAARLPIGRHVTLGARPAALGAGLGAPLAGVVAFTIFGFGPGSDPAVKAFMRAGESHATAHPFDACAVAQGAVIGLGAGTINLAYASPGGLLVGIREGRSATRTLRELARWPGEVILTSAMIAGWEIIIGNDAMRKQRLVPLFPAFRPLYLDDAL